MPSRVIKESILSSPNLNRLSEKAECHFFRLLVTADDHGCFEATPLLVKGTVYPLRPKVTVEDIKARHAELQEQGLCMFWENGDERMYGIFTSFSSHQRIRSLHRRKTPEPPKDLQPADLKKKPAAKKKTSGKTWYTEEFEAFWLEYPRKDGKKKALEAWERLLAEDIMPSLDKVITAVRVQRNKEQWMKSGGEFIPLATTWLNQQRWDDQGVVQTSVAKLCPYCKVANSDYRHTTEGEMCTNCYVTGKYMEGKT